MALGLLAAGCDEEPSEQDLACEMAAETIETCFGDGSADAFLASCGPADVARVQGRACIDLTTVLLDEKADSAWDGAVLDAVREALHEGISQGLTVALQQVLERLGGVSAEDYAGYLLLGQADSEEDAQRAAAQWDADLAGRPGFDPTVVRWDGGWGVAHAPCVLGLDDVLPELVADLVMASPDTIEVLGGTINEVTETETTRELSVSLPITLLPTPRDDAEHPQCP